MIPRTAVPADAADIMRIRNRVIVDTPFTFTSEAITCIDGILADIAVRGAAYQVIEIAGQVQGIATYFPFRGGAGYSRTKELSIMLDPTAHRRGAGRALMETLQTHARSKGVHTLVAAISGENPAAVRFHKVLGFSQVGHMPEVGFKFGRWMDLLLMQKNL